MPKVKRAAVAGTIALDCRKSATHELDPALGITALSHQCPVKETRPVLRLCQFMLDTVSYCFFRVYQGTLRITA
jgi:hypothetical protein